MSQGRRRGGRHRDGAGIAHRDGWTGWTEGRQDNDIKRPGDLTSAEMLVLYAVVSKEKGCLSS